MSPTPEEIKKQDIIDQLTWDNSVNANEVYVNIKDGTVLLKGTVPTYASKVAAEKNVYEVPGVTRVENYLKVEIPSDVTRPTDQEITENIESKLISNSRINAVNIKVDVIEGIVTLSGFTGSYWEKKHAEDIVLDTRGVIEVINNLQVHIAKSIIDTDIEKDIKNTLKRSGISDYDQITVSSNEGVVRLSGVLPGYNEKNKANKIAMYTAGVVDVLDDITVV
ncbi:MAG: BON domain-containing protein [Bacteroidales bacterium]